MSICGLGLVPRSHQPGACHNYMKRQLALCAISLGALRGVEFYLESERLCAVCVYIFALFCTTKFG